MPSYLVETYVPLSQAPDARIAGERVRTVAKGFSRQGEAVRHVRTTFVPDDETCFHFLEAASIQIVHEVCRRAGIDSARIVAAVE